GGRVFFDGEAQLLQALAGAAQPAARQHVADRREARVDAGDARILRKVADDAATKDRAAEGLGLTGQHLQQARLADAGSADQADLVAGVHGEGPLLQHEAASDVQRDTANLQHGGSRVAAARPYTRARMGGFLRGPTLWFTERATVRRLFTEHRLGRRFAARFVAGDTLEDAMRVAGGLRASGIRTMLNHLGEEVASPAQAAAATDAYVRGLKRIHEQPAIDANVSVKLTQLGLDVSTELCMEHMERVLQAASGALVMIDMESRQYVDRTIE